MMAEMVLFHDFTDEDTGEYLDPLEAAGEAFGDVLNTPACSTAAKQHKAELEDDLADTD